jgi:hypothetical protein
MINVSALTGFTILEGGRGFPQLVCCGKKYSKLKLVNI